MTNYYNTDQTLNYKIDAKGQKVQFNYDSYKRATQVSKFPDGTNEDVCQRVNYYYDSNPDISSYPYNQSTAGRLTSVHYAGASCQSFSSATQTATTGNNYVEMYAYTQAGQVTNKRLRLVKKSDYFNPATISADLEAVYTFDQEGKMASVQYPLGTTYQYGYDNLGRATSMLDTQANSQLVSSVTYGPAGELLSMTGSAVNETRSYNALGQLKSLVGINGVNLQYNYPSSGNNGQIASQYDVQSGETVTYAYDQLKRLSSATSTQGWSQNFGYDGFGNLTAKTGSGVAPVGSYPADPATNRLSGTQYDSNGNQLYANGATLVYDVANRMSGSTGTSLQGAYEYDTLNRRVYQLQQSWNGSIWVTNAQWYYFYGLNGKQIGKYTATVSGFGPGASMSWSLQSTQVFFKGRLIKDPGGNEQTDIRGSVGKYYPYGENRGTPPADSVQFATYTGDSVSGLDYAVNRFYEPGVGRFNTPDPYVAAPGAPSKPADPQSWNRFLYVQGDPLTNVDPHGTCLELANLDRASFSRLSFDDCCPECNIEPGPGEPGPQCPAGTHPDPTIDNCAPNEPTCEIDLYERPVGGTASPFNHTYLELVDASGGITILESGPSRKPKTPNIFGGNWGAMYGRIEQWNSGGWTGGDTPLNGTNPNSSSNSKLGADIGGSDICNDIAMLIGDVQAYDSGPKVPYRPWPFKGSGTYNSNSFTFTLLAEIGLLGGQFASPTYAPGWGLWVPGL